MVRWIEKTSNGNVDQSYKRAAEREFGEEVFGNTKWKSKPRLWQSFVSTYTIFDYGRYPGHTRIFLAKIKPSSLHLLPISQTPKGKTPKGKTPPGENGDGFNWTLFAVGICVAVILFPAAYFTYRVVKSKAELPSESDRQPLRLPKVKPIRRWSSATSSLECKNI